MITSITITNVRLTIYVHTDGATVTAQSGEFPCEVLLARAVNAQERDHILSVIRDSLPTPAEKSDEKSDEKPDEKSDEKSDEKPDEKPAASADVDSDFP